MGKIQFFFSFCKKPSFILFLILSAFFFQGIFLSILIPIFSGQDEARHYNTIQYLAEPEEKNWEINTNPDNEGDKFQRYNYTEEIERTSESIRCPNEDSESCILFGGGYDGPNEDLINSRPWRQYNTDYPPNIVASNIAFHTPVSWIEKLFSHKSILIRFYLERIFMVTLGTLAVFLSFLIFKNIGFGEKNSIILTAILSFQPKFSNYTTNINYDALLIPTFFLFALGGVLFIKNGPGWKNLLALGLSLVVGIFTKGTAVVLVAPLGLLIIFYLYQNFRSGSISAKETVAFVLAFGITAIFLLNRFGVLSWLIYDLKIKDFFDFLSEGLKKWDYTSYQYWGRLDWDILNLSDEFVSGIWFLEALGIIGLIFFFIARKTPEFIPNKKQTAFLIMSLLALQFGIIFFSWKLTSSGQEKLLLSPGRYFIPNLAAHLAVMFTGLGMLLRKEKYLTILLSAFLLFMFAFQAYLIANVMLPRFYL